MKKSPYLIAVTGGIGSGKSKVIEFASELGYPTLSCDKITAECHDMPRVKGWLKSNFPQAVKGNIFKKIDKKAVSKIVFQDKEKLKLLTDFLTPLVLEECLKRAKRLKGVVFVEVPLLFECGKQQLFDKVIVVTRNLQVRIDSVCKRNNLTKEEVLERISAQFDYENADLTPYSILNNDGDLTALKTNLIKILEEIK